MPANTASDYVGLRDLNLFSYNAPVQQPVVPYWQSSEDPGAGALPAMQYRRWYPTATTLGTGEVLVTSGQRYGGLYTKDPNGVVTHGAPFFAELPEVWNPATGQWRTLTGAVLRQALYPCMFQAPDGRVFEAGPTQQTHFLSTSGTGTWTNGPLLSVASREAGSAVMYEPGKLLLLGGGNPTVTASTDLITLTDAGAQVRPGPAMAYARRHLNATLLPDGTVLASGGTTTVDPDERNAVLPTELWTPPSSTQPSYWRPMAALSIPRCYHSTALLLPDGRVLTAGQGEGGYFVDHPDYQIFSPPYLFRGPRPECTQAPARVVYGQSFEVQTPDPAGVAAVNWLRLSSVTHSFNMNQRLNHLSFVRGAGRLTLTAPGNPNDCPPGQYLLFLLTADGVPSVARVITIGPAACPTAVALTQQTTRSGCSAQVQVSASVSSPVTSYRWSVNGTPDPSLDGQVSISLYLSNFAPTAQVSVTVTPACGDPELTSSQNVAAFFPDCDSN